MSKLSEIAAKLRSKNAGPFWLTIDIFFDGDDEFQRVCNSLQSEAVANLLGADVTQLKRFEIADLRVLKFSLPRPQVQGSRLDRDMHGASFANLLADVEI